MAKLISLVGLTLISLFMGAIPALAEPNDVRMVKDVYPGFATGALASARLVDMPAGVLLRSGEIEITQKNLNALIGKEPEDVRAQMKRDLFLVLENKATQLFLQYEAADWAKHNQNSSNGSEGDLVGAYLSGLAANLTISDDEAKSFFDANKDMVSGATFDQVKDQLKDYLLSQKRQDAIQAHITATGDRYEIDVNKAWAAKQYSAAMTNPIDQARKSGKPTMVDLGADGCRPCDMMAPILESLKKEYAGKVNVMFVHVRKQQILAARYRVQSIPVQVFFDKDGKEIFRHVGFFAKDQITAKFAEMGVK